MVNRETTILVIDDERAIREMVVMALEGISDHAKNICEYVIYLVKGKDVRHTSIEKMEKAALKNR